MVAFLLMVDSSNYGFHTVAYWGMHHFLNTELVVPLLWLI